MTPEDLIDALAAMLQARDHERERESMPALQVEASDGTLLVVTLAAHQREGCLE